MNAGPDDMLDSPDSGDDAPVPRPRSDNRAKPPAERRRRQREVASLLARFYTPSEVLQTVVPKYGVDARTVGRDIKLVVRRWATEDTKHARTLRARIVRWLSNIAIRADAAGDLDLARKTVVDIARVNGLLHEQTVHLTAETAIVMPDLRSMFPAYVGMLEAERAPDGSPPALPAAPDTVEGPDPTEPPPAGDDERS